MEHPRESFWAMKARVKGRSVDYLPPNLREEAYTLEENGRWEDVSYEGEPRRFWRPTTVAVGWSPFTVGRWDRLVWRPMLDSGGTLRVRHPPLRQLGLREEIRGTGLRLW